MYTSLRGAHMTTNYYMVRVEAPEVHEVYSDDNEEWESRVDHMKILGAYAKSEKREITKLKKQGFEALPAYMYPGDSIHIYIRGEKKPPGEFTQVDKNICPYKLVYDKSKDKYIDAKTLEEYFNLQSKR